MPDINAPVNYGANLGSTLSQVAPLATSFHGALSQQGGISQVFNAQATTKAPSIMSQFVGKVESIGKESEHLFTGAADWVLHQGESMVTAVPKFAVNSVKFGIDAFDSHTQSEQVNAMSNKLQTLTDMYKQGNISQSQYKTELNSWMKEQQQLTSRLSDLSTRINTDGGNLEKSSIDATAAVLTVMTAGGAAVADGALDAGESATAALLNSSAADTAMSGVEDTVGKLATDAVAFKGAPSIIQSNVKDAVLKTLFNASSNMTSQQIARATASHLLLSYPLTFNAMSSTGQQLYTELQSGKYGDAIKTAAFNAALLLSGGPIGKALQLGGKGLGIAKNAVFGENSGLDELSRQIFNGDSAAAYNFIKDDPQLSRNIGATLNTNIAAENGDIVKGVNRIVNGLRNASWDIDGTPGETLLKDMDNWASSQRQLTESLVSKGMEPADAARYVVGRWTVSDANYVAAHLTAQTPGIVKTTEDYLQDWDSLKSANPNASWANNEGLDRQITSILESGNSPGKIDSDIRTIEAQFGNIPNVSKSVARQLAKKGYVGIEPANLEAPFKEGTALKTQFTSGSEDFFLKTTQPLPVLDSVGSLLTNVGLSPDAATQRVYDVFSSNMAENLKEADFLPNIGGYTAEENADGIAKSLANYVHNMKPSLKSPPVTDYRQLTLKDIQKAIGGISREDAKTVRAVLMDSMLQVPLSVRGLGDKIADLNYKINPTAGAYGRLQGALRYAWNPFFQMRLSYKAEFLSQIEAGGKFPTIAGTNKMLQIVMPEKYQELDDISKTLESNGIFGGGYAAEGADEQAAGYANLQHELLPGQKRSISGLVGVMADRAEMTPEQFVQSFPNETKDTVRMILQYDPRANFLNSPLARTLNFAFFPFRFNLKVSTIIARQLGKQSLGMQFAVVKGMMQAHQFLSSAEGMQWYSQNADVIGLFKYFSPLETLSSIAQALGAKPGNVAAYGELGGLPFGWIPGLLNAEGLINTNTPYVNPTTGAIAQQYVPISTRGRAQAAIEDFIGSIFTYPGSTVGLPSKTSLDVKIAQGLVPGGSTNDDFNKITPQLTPQQQQFQQAVQQLNGTANQQAATTPGSGGPTQNPLLPGVNVPVQPSTITNASTYAKPSSGSSAKKKKAEETPYLLPGQSTLGQIPGSS